MAGNTPGTRKSLFRENSHKEPDNTKWRSLLGKHWPWIIIILILIFAAAIRIRLLQIPLERDEGEFAYMRQLMLHGIPPYLLAYNMKLPGTYGAYALIMAIFGKTISGIHLGLLCANCAATIMIFMLARRILDDIAGIVAGAGYAMLSLSPTVLGTSAHATQLIVPFALGGTMLLLRALESGRLWLVSFSGFLFGIAFILKQHAIFFVVFAVLYYIAHQPKRCQQTTWERLIIEVGLFTGAAALPFLLSCAILYATGVFDRYWFWTFTYAHEYACVLPLTVLPERFISSFRAVTSGWIWYWSLALLGLVSIFWNRNGKSVRVFLLGFSFFSALTVFPGLFFRSHYFITMLPATALLAGTATSTMIQLLRDKKMPRPIQALPVLIPAISLIYPTIVFKDFFFLASPSQACRMMFSSNPFPESLEIADYIKSHTGEADKIVVIGSEPQIYFYSDRKSVTGYIYMYSLMEPQAYASAMQKDMIHEIESSKPEYAVFVDNPYSWVLYDDSDTTILDWTKRYLSENYRAVGVILHAKGSLDHTSFWEKDIERSASEIDRDSTVYVMKRKQP